MSQENVESQENGEKTFFGKLIAILVNAFKANWKQWVQKIWNKSVPDDIKPEVTVIVDILERIKTFVDGPGLDFITWAIPGPDDDAYVLKLRDILRTTTFNYGLDQKPVSQYLRGDLQTIASELTAGYFDMPYGQAAITAQVGFENKINIPKEEANA